MVMRVGSKQIMHSVLVAATLLPGVGRAASFFSEDFSDNAMPANMEIAFGNNVTFADGQAQFDGINVSTGRTWIRTKEADYSTIDFIFEGTVTMQGGAMDRANLAWLGMGDTTANVFNEPNVGSPTALQNMYYFSRNDVNALGVQPGAVQFTGIADGDLEAYSTHRVQMIWDSTTSMATYNFDRDYDGTFVADDTITIGPLTFAGSAHLWLGGQADSDNPAGTPPGPGDPLIWDDIVVRAPVVDTETYRVILQQSTNFIDGNWLSISNWNATVTAGLDRVYYRLRLLRE